MTKLSRLDWCVVCLRRLPDRRWWQRGLFAPFPFCAGDDIPACRARIDSTRREARFL